MNSHPSGDSAIFTVTDRAAFQLARPFASPSIGRSVNKRRCSVTVMVSPLSSRQPLATKANL
jgi:hypothetical protein